MSVSLWDFDAAIRSQRRVRWLVGVDEAGRGPLAGPVVAAAVRLGGIAHPGLQEARDSKLLSAHQREALFPLICRHAAAVAVGWSQPREIERLNILAATLAAMRRASLRAVQGKRLQDGVLVLVDGNRSIPDLPLAQMTIIDGDRLSLAVACASIVAKVVRDRWMERLDRRFPGYGLARHKGYGTAAHRDALLRLGPSPTHRMTFSGVTQLELI